MHERRNLLICGPAGSGKTSLLAALLAEVPPTERIVTVEDVAELVIDHPHVVGLEARQPNADGAGGVGLARLVREALRMRPDRLVVGECRGAEIVELLARDEHRARRRSRDRAQRGHRRGSARGSRRSARSPGWPRTRSGARCAPRSIVVVHLDADDGGAASSGSAAGRPRSTGSTVVRPP